MTKISKSIFIKVSVEEVFSYASDWQKWEEWFAGVSDFRPITEKKTGNGTRYAYKAKMMGLSVSVETEISNYAVNKGWTGKATKGMPHQTQWIFEPFESGTNFTYVLEYEIPFPLLGVMFDRMIMRPRWNKIIETSLENLRKKIYLHFGLPATVNVM